MLSRLTTKFLEQNTIALNKNLGRTTVFAGQTLLKYLLSTVIRDKHIHCDPSNVVCFS